MVNAMFVASLMAKLGISEEEARQVLEDDKRIDRGEKLFELSAEQEKASKQARQADRKPTVYKLDNTNGKRSKKADDDKRFLLNALIIGLCDSIGMDANKEVEVTNTEREFVFTYNGRKFKVVLSAPRS
jgi:hypothetical protein